MSPGGERFFSLGVCVVTQGATREDFDSENPGYAGWRHYETSEAWADASLRRLKAWGFTTAGGWSEFDTLRKSREQTLWLTPVLHIGSTAGAPWWDMWAPKNIRRMEGVARDQIVPLREDPRLLGYLCWHPRALHLGLYALDIVEEAYYRGASVPKQDRALWTVQVNGREPVRARLGGGREPLVNSPEVRIEGLSGLDLNVRSIAALELPSTLLGKTELGAGDSIELSVTLSTHARAYRVEWTGRFRLSE